MWRVCQNRRVQHEQARHFLAALTRLEINRDTSVGDMTLAEWLTWAESRLVEGNPLNHGVEALFADIEKITSYTSFKKPIY